MASKLEGHKPLTLCNNCHKDLTKVLTCSRCKNATYCSKECQREHWRDHKPRCQLNQQNKAAAAADHNKRGFRLLQQFRDAARNEGLLAALVKAFPDKASFLQQPSPSAVTLEIQFDYNYKSFLPTGPATFVPDKRILPADMQVEPPSLPSEPGYVLHTLFLVYEKSGFVMPMRMTTLAWEFHKESWDNIYNMLRIVKLKSSVFDTPQFHPGANVKQQLLVIQQQPGLSLFLANALAMNSTHPLHKEKVVVIDVELGFGLGEIKQLSSWSLETPAALLRSLGNLLPPAQVEHYRSSDLNLTNSCPHLARADPGSSYCPILFRNIKAGLFFIMPNCFVFERTPPPTSKNECRRTAQHLFQQLQRVQLPAVQSPPIE